MGRLDRERARLAKYVAPLVIVAALGMVLLGYLDLPGRVGDRSQGRSQAIRDASTIRIQDPTSPRTGTALIAQVVSERDTTIERNLTNIGYWTGTRAIVMRNIRFHDLAPNRIESASSANFKNVHCPAFHQGDGHGGTCPPDSVRRNGGFFTGGNIDKGTEIWYSAAFGADRAQLSIVATAGGPLRLRWVQETTTEVHEIAPMGRVNASVNLTIDRPSYGILTPLGTYGRSPTFWIDAPHDQYRFHRKNGSWLDDTNSSILVPGFPMSPGNYTIEARGGRPPQEGGDPPLLTLSLIVEPRFVHPSGRFVSLGDSR